MSHRTVSVLVLSVLFLMGMHSRLLADAGWVVETVDSEYVGKFDSLAIDSSGRPHISYYDAKNGNVKYATKTGRKWSIEIVAFAGKPNTQLSPVYTSIAVDSAGNPRIVFFDDNTAKVKYAVRSGTSWATEDVDPGCGSTCPMNGFFPSLALDSAGNPHVSYYGNGGGITNGYLMYATKLGGGWQIERVDEDGDSGLETSIAIDSSGKPQIAYMSYPSLLSHTVSTLKYAVKLGSSWTKESVDSSGRVTAPSLSLDSSGNPHISYHESNNGSLLYAVKSGGSWILQIVDQMSDRNVGQYNSLVLDRKTDEPRISYFDISNHLLRYVSASGQNWTKQVVDSNGDVGRYCRLAFDRLGLVHISYYDAINHSLKYASPLPILAKPLRDYITVSPKYFPYRVTMQTVCAESLLGICLHHQIVSTCVGAECFDVPSNVTPAKCVVCAIAIGGIMGLIVGGIGIAWLNGVWLASESKGKVNAA